MTLNNRVTKLETQQQSLSINQSKVENEIEKIRKKYHDISNVVHKTTALQKDSVSDVKELVINNANQIKIVNEHVMLLSEKHGDMKVAVDNNTQVMFELKGGLKLFIWVVGSVGAIVSITKILEMI